MTFNMELLYNTLYVYNIISLAMIIILISIILYITWHPVIATIIIAPYIIILIGQSLTADRVHSKKESKDIKRLP